MNFIPLLKSGIPLDMPDNKKLYVGFLSEENHCGGTRIEELCLSRKTDIVKLPLFLGNCLL
jgi:hypothetical protein